MRTARLLFYIIILSSLSTALQAQVPDTANPKIVESCPSIQEARTLLDNKITLLTQQSTQLKDFLEGKFDPELSLERIFSVDLKNREDIKTKLNELKNPNWIPNSPLLNCFANEEQYSKEIEQLKIFHQNLRELKIVFFELPFETRQILLSSFENFQEHTNQTIQLEKEKKESLLKQQEAEQNAIIAENKVKEAENVELKQLASERVILEEAKADLTQFQTQWKELLKLRQEFYIEASNTLGDLSAQLATELSLENLEQNYRTITVLWNEISQRIYQSYHRQEILFKIPKLPKKPEKVLETLKDNEEVKQYKQSYQDALKIRDDLSQSIQIRLDEENHQNFNILLTAGQLRAQYIALLRNFKHTSALSFNRKYLNDLSNEIRIIPYRWMATFYSRILEVRQQVRLGIKGYLFLAKNVLMVTLVLFIVIGFWISLKNLSRFLTQFKDQLIHRHTRSSLFRTLAIWIPRINPYIPWALTLFALKLTYDLLENTLLAELSLFLPYIEYYVIYRIFRELITNVFISFSFRARITLSPFLRKQIQSTAKVLGILLFIIFIVLHTVSSIARKGLLYYHAIELSWALSFIIFITLIHSWRKELAHAIEASFPRLGSALAQLCDKWWGFPCQLLSVILLILVYIFQFLKERTSELEVSKRISAKLFKRQIEKGTKREANDTHRRLPVEYLKYFNYDVPEDDSLLIQPQSDLLKTSILMIENWKQDSSEEHALTFYGDKGSGKSSLLKIIQNKIKDIQVIHVCIPPKLTSKETTNDYFAQLLKSTSQNKENWLYETDEKMEKTLILLDECQNLFLGKVDGFEGFKAFTDLINLKTKNIFWCMTFNRQSWNYLYDVFGRDEFCRTVRKLKAWSDEDIQSLIETRHTKSNFSLSYDQIISAVSSNHDLENSYSHVERKFFQLLWELSDGNPRAAIHYWLSSLTAISEKKLKVGLPEEENDYRLTTLPDDLHFIYAQLVKHENITSDEALEVSNLSRGTVTNALKVGLERGFLERSESGRYRVTPKAQESLLKFLTARNFIYGN